MKPLKTNTYLKGIKQVLVSLGLNPSKLKHLGRGVGAKKLEMLELEAESIRQLGNWNPSIQE